MFKKETDKYFTLLSLYLAQSIPMSFFSTVVPVIMRMENYSLESIGYLQLIKLPWIAKFFWAPFIDHTSQNLRHYRRWILGSELFYAIVIIGIGFLNLQTDFMTIVILMVIAFTASATQDIATDAFAILSLRKEERSLGNSMQSAGNFLGTMVGSGVLLVIYHYYGWSNLLFGLSGLVVLALIPVMIYKAPANRISHSSQKKVSWLDFAHFFKQKGIWRHVMLLLIFYSGIIGILTMLKPYLVDLGYSVKQIGFIVGIFGTGTGALMTIPAGIFIRKKGLKRTLYILPAVNLLVAIYFTGLTFTSHPAYLIYIGIGLLWAAYAMSSVFVYTLSMGIVRKGREGTDFTVQIVLTHLSSLIISVSSGKIADMFTYRGLFVAEIGIGVLIMVLLYSLYREKFYENNDRS
jgi:predicted MFS family arabinose efflux permease